jgi:ABC-2 type transport system permease protein
MNGLVLRMGLGAETLVWVVIVGLAPISAVYYPIAALPDWLEPVAWVLPSANVFEGMRAILLDGAFRADLMWRAAALNVVYLAVGAAVFMLCFEAARRRALLLQIGE